MKLKKPQYVWSWYDPAGRSRQGVVLTEYESEKQVSGIIPYKIFKKICQNYGDGEKFKTKALRCKPEDWEALLLLEVLDA